MFDPARIRPQMEVVDGDGQHIGTVDRVEGAQLKLTKSDPSAGGEHRYIPLADIDDVGAVVKLKPASVGTPPYQF
jgi:hypothetical protein